jgi:UDP-glucose 4-epimerase
MRKRYLITGGAGFVGSHVVAELLRKDADCVVFDNLSTGHREAVLPGAELIEGDLADVALVDQVVGGRKWDAVLHFAAKSLVSESMELPFAYLKSNVENGTCLIEACTRHGVGSFVFSSTAALFGNHSIGPIDENTPISPGSPYGESKWMVERALHWAHRIHGMRSVCLRYFNACGSDPAGRMGEDHSPETHLIPLVVDTALGRRGHIQVFGADFATRDGTAVRDYIHVSDLADAHVRVLDHMANACTPFNVGTGVGHSVLDIIRSVERVTGRKVLSEQVCRRAGDPASLVASSIKIRNATGWGPRFDSLDSIVRTALNWRETHPLGYAH